MPSYYRGRRWRRRPRRYVRRWFRRRVRRFVNGSSRSIARIKTSFTLTKEVSAGYGTTPGTVVYTVPYGTNVADGSLYHSLLYRQYCNLYEQVKIIGVKIAFAVVTPVGDVTTPSLQIYTAWDRNWGQGDQVPTGNSIVSSSTYNVATALNNNVAKITRACYASDLMEKATWIDTDVSEYGTNKAWYAAQQNPNMFSPSFMFTCLSPSLGAAHNITVSLSFTYYLAFRNPKFGGGAESEAKVQDLGVRAVSFPDADDDGDMDAEDNGDVEPAQPQIDAALARAAVGGSTVKSQPKSAALMEASHRKKHAATKAIVLDPPSKNA